MITRTTPLQTIRELAPPCSCTKCSHGCTMGSGILSKEDVQKIATFLNVTLDVLKKDFLEEVELFNKKHFRPKIKRENKPYGMCIFYKDKKCSIHKVKPLQCKISMGCKDYGEDLTAWFMLNYVINKHDPQAIREYKDYLDSGGKKIVGGELHDLVKDKETLKKMLDYTILK